MKIRITESQYDRLQNDLLGGSQGTVFDAQFNNMEKSSDPLIDKLYKLVEHDYTIINDNSPNFFKYSKIINPLKTGIYCLYDKSKNKELTSKSGKLLLFPNEKVAHEYFEKYKNYPSVSNSVVSQMMAFSSLNDVNENIKHGENLLILLGVKVIFSK